ncbi:hypothetical protein ACFQ9X_35850 [Catenulispora yoronensis]
MADNFVMVTGDTVSVTIPGIVIPVAQTPQPLVGTSQDLTFGGAFVCLEGDELAPTLKGPLTFTESGYSITGTGTLKLVPSPGVNLTTLLKDNNKALLIKGAPFSAVFTVTTPAANPNGQTASNAPKNGTATFATKNNVFTAQ